MAASSASLAFRSRLHTSSRALSLSRCHHRPSLLQRQGGLRSLINKRDASTGEDLKKEVSKKASEVPKKAGNGLRKTVLGTSLLFTLLAGYVYFTDTRASIHRYGVVPIVRLIFPDAEDAHHEGVKGLKRLYDLGLNPRERGNPDADGVLATEVRYPSLCKPWTGPYRNSNVYRCLATH